MKAIAVIALCMVLGIVQHHWEKRSMTEPGWLTNMTPRQQNILGWTTIAILVLISSGWALWSIQSGIPMP